MSELKFQQNRMIFIQLFSQILDAFYFLESKSNYNINHMTINPSNILRQSEVVSDSILENEENSK